MCPSKGTALSVQDTLPHVSPLTVGQPTSRNCRMQGNEAPVPGPQFRTLLKGYHRSGAFGGIGWHLNYNLTASQLLHLSKLAFLTSLWVCLLRAFFSKPSRHNSPFLSLDPGSPPKMHGVYQARGQATEARAEPRSRDASDRAMNQFCAWWCERSSVTVQTERMAALHSVITRSNALNVSICFKGLLLPNLYKIWWKAKWNLERQGQSEGTILEKGERKPYGKQ